MSYHLKHRPATWAEIIGNEGTVASLQALVKKPDHPRTFLFHGPSGYGKTTLARILMRELGAKESDIIEVNASNNRGIDTVREILETMTLRPLFGTVRGYILDEVHQTTKDFQNAILKALEDTPEHVLFVLCTTDPGKLLPTVRNRCVEMKVEELLPDEREALLSAVVKREGIQVEKETLRKIAQIASSARQALILLEQVAGVEPEKREALVQAANVDEKLPVIHLCRLLAKGTGSWKQYAGALKRIDDEAEAVRRALLGYMQALLLSETTDEGTRERAWAVIQIFRAPLWDIGKPGLVAGIYEAWDSFSGK